MFLCTQTQLKYFKISVFDGVTNLCHYYNNNIKLEHMKIKTQFSTYFKYTSPTFKTNLKFLN